MHKNTIFADFCAFFSKFSGMESADVFVGALPLPYNRFANPPSFHVIARPQRGRGNPPKPSPGEKVAERKRGRKWNAGGNVGQEECIDFLKCRSGISLNIFRPLGDHPHSTSVICSFFANASFSPGEAICRLRRTDRRGRPSLHWLGPLSFCVIARSEATWQSPGRIRRFAPHPRPPLLRG